MTQLPFRPFQCTLDKFVQGSIQQLSSRVNESVCAIERYGEVNGCVGYSGTRYQPLSGAAGVSCLQEEGPYMMTRVRNMTLVSLCVVLSGDCNKRIKK